MGIKIGNKNIAAIFKGTTEIKEVFRGTTQIFVSGTNTPTLTLIATRQSQVVLRVTNNDPDVVNFTEIKYGSETFTSALTINGNGGTRDFTITGLAMTTPFSFIANVDADGKGLSSDSNTISTTTLAQQMPNIESVSAPSPTSIRFRLRNNNAETTTVRYRISGSDPTTSSAGVSLAANGLSSFITISDQPQDSLRTIRAATFINNIKGPVRQAQVTTPSIFFDVSGSPGNSLPLFSDVSRGIAYYGAVSHTELWTANEFVSAVGFDTGGLPNVASNEQPWHKYYWNGGIHFWRMPVRSNAQFFVIWNNGAVFGTGTNISRKGTGPKSGTGFVSSTAQNKQISKNGITYKVRLMEGAVSDPTSRGSNLHGSEWNLIMGNLHRSTNTGSHVYNSEIYSTPLGNRGDGDWNIFTSDSYNNNDFVGWNTTLTDYDFGAFFPGNSPMMQEQTTLGVTTGALTRLEQGFAAGVLRGYLMSSMVTSYTTNSEQNGWLPVLSVSHPSFNW